MKKLMNTLYIASPNRYLSLDGENIVVLEEKLEIGRVPLHNIESIITFGYTGASPALMGACAERGIGLCFMSQQGKFLARVVGEVRGNVILRKTQYALSENDEESIKVARNFIIGKVYNARWCLERVTREHTLRIDVNRVKKASGSMKKALENIKKCNNKDRLRGIEGEAASLYFSVFDQMILQQKEDFYFHSRNKRLPLDNVNALLSFTYTLLANMCMSALELTGLDPYVGFMHSDRPGRASLALDLMEELRTVLAERFVLSIINKRIINEKGFVKTESGAVFMDDETRKSVLQFWQERKKETLRHPFINEKVEWGMVPYVQAMLLARFIRGDLDEYPPFLWK